MPLCTYRDPVSDAYNKTCGTEDDIFVSLLEPAHSKQESPLSVFAEPYCTTIACYDSSLSIATRIMMFGETMLLLVHSKNNSLICGYSSVLIPTGYSSSFVIGKDLVKEYISSFIVLCTNCGKVSNDSAAILISDYLVTSYFGLDVSLSKCKILLYGTCSTNGDIFYAVIPSTDHCFKEVNLKSCLLLSMNQPVIEVLAHTILCSNDTEVGANSLFFIGKEGKVCVLFSFKKSSDSKEFLLNIPVYSACVLKHYLLMSSYKEIMVINLECKGNNKEESFCISTLLVKAFCNPKILKIDSVTKMCVDTRRSSVLLAKRNGCVYALNESDLASKLLSPLGNNLQEVVTKLGEVSDKIDMLKKNLNTTDMCLKQLNGSIGLFLSVNLRDENNALFSCQLLPEIYDQKNGEISVKLDLKYSGSKPSADGWFLSIHMTSSNYTCGFSFYSLSDFTQDETFSHHIKLCTKHLAIKVTWSIYCHFTHEELSRSNKVAGICSVIKQERLNVLGFLKKLNSNTLQQHSLCNMEGHLTLSKQSWERTNFKNIFLCEADSDTANLHLANSFLIHKTNIAHVVHMHKINKGECVIGRFLTNSAAFVCELRAAFIENVKVSMFYHIVLHVTAGYYNTYALAFARCFVITTCIIQSDQKSITGIVEYVYICVWLHYSYNIIICVYKL